MQGSGGEAIQVEKVPKCWRRHLVLKEFSDGKTFLNIPINNENIKLIRSAKCMPDVAGVGIHQTKVVKILRR